MFPIKLFKLLILCFCVPVFASKQKDQQNQKLLMEAKVAIDAKNYPLADQIYSKLSNKRLMLAKKQALLDLAGDYPRALVLANKRFISASFLRRLEILQEIYLFQVKLGLYKSKRYLPNFLHRSFPFLKIVEGPIAKLVFYKNCITNFGVEFLVLLLWILFLFSIFLSFNSVFQILLFALFASSGFELYQRFVVNNPSKIAFVVQKEVKLMTKPDFEDATELSSSALTPGERVDILEQRENALRVVTSDNESGWISTKTVERLK